MRGASSAALLHAASSCGQTELVDLILRKGASVALRGAKGFTPLHSAARYGQAAVTKRLLAAGADVNAITVPEGLTALMLCATCGRKTVVPVLLSHGALVTTRDEKGMTAAMYAQAHRHNNMLLLLKRHQQALRRQANHQTSTRQPPGGGAPRGGGEGIIGRRSMSVLDMT